MATVTIVPAAIACAALAMPTPLSGQTEFTGARIPVWEKSELRAGNLAARILYGAAVCFWDRYRDKSLVLLESERGTAGEDQAYRSLISLSNEATRTDKDHLACFTLPASKKNVPKDDKIYLRSRALLRGAIAEAFYNRQRVRPRGVDAVTLDDSFGRMAARVPAQRPTERRELVGRWTAFCAAHAAPHIVHKVVTAAPASTPETKALQALGPTLLKCLPAGETLLVERLTMRTLLSEGLWRASRTHRSSFINA